MILPKNHTSSDISKENKLDNNSIHYLICAPDIYPLASLLRVRGFYVMGNTALLSQTIIGIVGSRDMSMYGKMIVESLITYISGSGIITLSGGANGIDSHTHETSVSCNIPTIMVLAGGIEWYLQSTKHSLCKKILSEGGLLVSEYHPREEPKKYTFPQRNRIIALLSSCIFIPEAGEKSGSLITATYANKIGKKVYGAPQDIFRKTSAGVNNGIAEGYIRPITSIGAFVLEAFPLHTCIGAVPNDGACRNDEDLISRSMIELGLL